jgi:uncharacterized membrane protein YfcA
MIEFWWAYPLLGAVVGLLAGLFGVGGGLIMVPVLNFIFVAKGFPQEHVLHMALGTAVTTILFTAISSVRIQHRHNAVRWDILRSSGAAIFIGTLAGSAMAGAISARPLSIIFAGLVYFIGIRMMIAPKPAPHRGLPGKIGMIVAGTLLGFVASFAAISGAAFSVSFMIRCNVRMHHAIATSSAIGIPIAIAGTIGYMAMGSRVELPAYSIGYVYVPAVIGIVFATMFAAPLGVKLSHRISAERLRKLFAVLLLLLATRMLWSFF